MPLADQSARTAAASSARASRMRTSKAARDLLGAPVDHGARDEAVRGLEHLDRQAGPVGEHTELAVDDEHGVRPLDDVLELEAELREARERVGVELADRRPAADDAVAAGPQHEHARALEDRRLGVMAHDAIEVAAVPSLEPVLDEPGVRQGCASTQRVISATTRSGRSSCGMWPVCSSTSSSLPGMRSW